MQKLGVLTAAAIIAAGVHGASAADLYSHGGGSLKDAPVDVPLPIWTGFYVGAGVGAAMGFHDTDFSGLNAGIVEVLGASLFEGNSDNGSSSVLGTLQIGYDRQVGSRWVIGAFADYDWTDLDSDLGNSAISSTIPLVGTVTAASVSSKAEIDSSWTLGGRVGFLATPSTMVYGLLGWTHANYDLSSEFTLVEVEGLAGGTFGDKKSADSDGFTIGAGVETMLRDNWSLKLEYRFTDLGSENISTPVVTLPLSLVTVDAATTHVDSEIHSVRAVLSYRLN
jgi:outer membrane immunogenic protein